MSASDQEERGPESARPSDRRARVRHIACFPAEIDTGSGPKICIIRDLSVSGAHLLTRAKLSVGSKVKISLYILDDSNPRVVEGEIMRWERRGADYSDTWPNSVGVRFDKLLEDCEAEIKAVAEQQAQSGVTSSRTPL